MNNKPSGAGVGSGEPDLHFEDCFFVDARGFSNRRIKVLDSERSPERHEFVPHNPSPIAQHLCALANCGQPREAEVHRASMPQLPFVCSKCGVQQHAEGICANCGAAPQPPPEAALCGECGHNEPGNVYGTEEVACVALVDNGHRVCGHRCTFPAPEANREAQLATLRSLCCNAPPENTGNGYVCSKCKRVWFNRELPVEAPAVAATPLTSCAICGGKRVRIRGRFPRQPEREVCPTCLAERMEQIQQITSMEYGAANVNDHQ